MTHQLSQGQTVCFTGKMSYDRLQMHDMALTAMLHATFKIYQADVLVIANGDYYRNVRSHKRQVAERRGIPVITENEFFAQIAQPLPMPGAASAAPAKATPAKAARRPRRAQDPNRLLKTWRPGAPGAVNF